MMGPYRVSDIGPEFDLDDVPYEGLSLRDVNLNTIDSNIAP